MVLYQAVIRLVLPGKSRWLNLNRPHPIARGKDGQHQHHQGLAGTRFDEPALKQVFDQISRDVPVGRAQHRDDRALTAAARPFAAPLSALARHLPPFEMTMEVVNCHHNHVAREHHYGENVWVTRKGAIRARAGDLGIIPGSMGARSYLVRGKGNPESFCSCAHGAGRRMSRTAAEQQFTVADLTAQTAGVICRKDQGVLDEIPGAYKDIDQVMANQADLVAVVHTLKQVLCVEG
jgi:hypothetical protein